MEEQPLPITVHSVAGRRSALLSTSDFERKQAYVRRIDESGRVGPLRTLRGRWPIGAYDAGRPWLLSSDGERLCVEPLDRDAPPTCNRLRADLAIVMPKGLALLEQRPDRADEPDEDTAASAKRKGRAPRAKRSKRKRARKRTLPKPVPMRIWLHPIDASGSIGERVDTTLSFDMPGPGMGLVDAVGTPDGAQLLWYEHASARGRSVTRARLRVARLDADGKLVKQSKRELFVGDRRLTNIEGHLAPRLFADGGRVLYVGRFENSNSAGWEAIGIVPRQALKGSAALFATDPLALDRKLGDQQRAALEAIAGRGPELTAGQPDTDPARVAWVGERGYFVSGGRLYAAKRDSTTISELDHPFHAQRGRIAWAALDSHGHGLVRTSSAFVELDPDGHIATHSVASAQRQPIGDPVHIADSWWMLVPRAGKGAAVELVRVRPTAASSNAPLAVHADSARLVGGQQQGLLAAVDGQRLSLWSLSPAGDLSALASHRSPVRAGFVATARPGGGLLLAGRGSADGRVWVAAYDQRGQLLGAQPASIDADSLRWGRSSAAGISWLSDAERTRVGWYTADGRELGSASWPQASSSASCIDGEPARVHWPTPSPGNFGVLQGVAAVGHCMSTTPLWTTDNRAQWFGTRVHGLRSEALWVRAAASAPRTVATTATAKPAAAPKGATPVKRPCPGDMVSIAGGYCIDRYESQLVDDSGAVLSPDYPTSPTMTQHALDYWSAARLLTGDLHARAMPLPALLRAPSAKPTPTARSRAGVRPSGYTSGLVAQAACEAAGKRLCTLDEWTKACRGEQDRQFPYGDDYQHGVCNVFRYAHPAATLHGNASVGHLDPRLNRVDDHTAGHTPLLRMTGATPACASRWGADAVHDMVGNLDEWVSKKGGAFAGGFYSRSTRAGCDAVITAHPSRYLDYSLGTRCCAAAH